jgi:hypothetical protein
VKLESLLIRVVQRIPRQKLFLEQIVSSTWTFHPDYKNLCIGLQKLEAVAVALNERKRDYENQQQMLSIEQTIEGGKVLATHRRFIKEGEFTEFTNKGQQIPIYVFLFNDTLLFAR